MLLNSHSLYTVQAVAVQRKRDRFFLDQGRWRASSLRKCSRRRCAAEPGVRMKRLSSSASAMVGGKSVPKACRIAQGVGVADDEVSFCFFGFGNEDAVFFGRDDEGLDACSFCERLGGLLGTLEFGGVDSDEPGVPQHPGERFGAGATGFGEGEGLWSPPAAFSAWRTRKMLGSSAWAALANTIRVSGGGRDDASWGETQLLRARLGERRCSRVTLLRRLFAGSDSRYGNGVPWLQRGVR